MIFIGIAVLIFCILIYYLTNKKNKSKMTKEKAWIVLERLEDIDGRTMRCYRAESKNNDTFSPCFKKMKELNNWISQNGK